MRSHLLTPSVSIALLALLPTALSHGHQVPVSDDADWATRHMAEEHHIANLDPSAFFTLHDYDSSGHWSPDEIRRTYGLDDESAKDVPVEKKINAVNEVIGMFDKDGDGGISREEWMDGWVKDGKRLPDFGVGCHNLFNELWTWAWRWAKLVGGRNSSTWTAFMLSYEGCPWGMLGLVLYSLGWILCSRCYEGYECYANHHFERQTGPGHHGDDEYEYEIHHFEKFHDESGSLLFQPFFAATY